MAKLKGHAVIELTDVKTGKKERVEHDNLITSAAAKLCDMVEKTFGYSILNSRFLPAKERLLRGLYLFDNTINENANNIYLPDVATAKITGYAGDITSDGNDNKRGDFNTSESGEITNGFKFVWDFGTDDANGEIAALGLTNGVAGYLGVNYEVYAAVTQSMSNNGNDYAHYKGLGMTPYTMPSNDDRKWTSSFENGIITTIHKTSTTNIRIRKYKIELSEINLDDTLVEPIFIEEENITIADSVQTTTDVIFIDGKDGFYYGLYGTNSGSNYVITLSKLNKSTKAYTAAQSYTLTALNAPKIKTVNSVTDTDHVGAIIRNGYLYAYYGTYNYNRSCTMGLYKAPLNNLSAYEKITNTEKVFYYGDYGNPFYMYLLNGNIYTAGYIVGSDDSFVEIAEDRVQPLRVLAAYSDYYYIFVDGVTAIIAYSSTSEYYQLVPYLPLLESINNLDAPVTKTAAKTMKITYTLTLAE